jgi:osmotically-inducible protein OsmY
MRKNLKVAVAIAAVVAVAGITSIVMRHGGDVTTSQKNRAQVVTPKIPDTAIVQAVRDANLRIDGLSATNVGGIVVLKGTADVASAQQAAAVVKQLGFARVANLIVTKPTADDEAIRRAAERQLMATRDLDGCNLRVSCTNGILRVDGTAYNELQIDVARKVLRNVGAQEVQVALKKL